jgi:hypothetical protein
MRIVSVVAVALALLFVVPCARARAAFYPFHSIEGPFTSIADYCTRMRGVRGTCVAEPVTAPLPPRTGPLRSVRFVRLHAERSYYVDRIVAVIETARGLFVDERVGAQYEHRGARNDSSVIAVDVGKRPSGGVRVLTALHGSRIPRGYTGDMCLVDLDGSVACSNPGTVWR